MNRYNDIDSSDYNDTNMGVGAYYESTEEKQIARLEKKVAALTNQLALCAAGSWRYDVENAPFDTQLLCWQETPDGCDWHCIGMKRTEQDEWECGLPGCVHDAPIAFAIINPPETPHA